MQSQEKLQLMMDRFVHPDSLFAEQVYYDKDIVTKTGKETKKVLSFFPVRHGDCTHTPKHKPADCPNVYEKTFTKKYLLQHLRGEKTYAPYQISQEDSVKWVCFDVDSYDDVPEDQVQAKTVEVARRVQKLVGPMHCLVEHSGSKGYHVWVFFDKPVPTRYAYAFGHTIVNDLGIDKKLIVEVYPKQQSNRVFGNTVKLPLGVHQKTGQRCFFVNSQFKPHEDQWEALARVVPVSSDWIRENITPVSVEDNGDKDYSKLEWVPLCLMEILDQGGSEGIRDEAAFRLSCYFRKTGLKKRHAALLLDEWNDRNDPPLDEGTLELKIESGYSRPYPFLPCQLPAFDAHCQSTCSFFAGKVKRRWFNPNDNPVGSISRE